MIWVLLIRAKQINLEVRGLNFTKEGSFTNFLGIKFKKDDVKGTLTLTQKGLIQKIKDATGMSESNYNWTPASQVALGTDPDGPAMNETWSYRSIVGMLLYLSTNTRPDISFAVSQVARFCHNPKRLERRGSNYSYFPTFRLHP